MNMLFIYILCRIYAFRDTESVSIQALALFGYFPLYLLNIYK